MRSLILALESSKCEKPNIIYCYFRDNEKDEFKPRYDKLNKFSEAITKYGEKININYIKTTDILEEYFYKNI